MQYNQNNFKINEILVQVCPDFKAYYKNRIVKTI